VYGGLAEWFAAAPQEASASLRDSASLGAASEEKRFDGDEGPFTKQEFFDVYGGYDEWNAAAPKAPSIQSKPAAKDEEKRFDGDEGPFTKQEFFDVYGGYDEWNAAAPKAPSVQAAFPASVQAPVAKAEEKRFDGDEGPFTKQEFFDVYGGYDEWNAAAPKAPSVQAAFPASVQAPIAKAEEKRFDGDEGPFTKHEFFDVYGGYDEWNAAAPPSSKPNNVMPPPAPKAVIPTRPADLPPAMPAPAMPKPAGGMNMLEELKAKQEAKRAAQEAAAAPVEVAPAAAEARKKDTSDVKASSKKADAKPDAPKAATKAVPKETTPSTATKKSVKTTTKEEVSKPKEKYTAPKPKVKPRPVPSAGRAPKADRHVATPAAPEKKERAKKPPAFKVDQLIEGRFEGKAKYFSGKVVKVRQELIELR
jgi:chemotaxis protein histidine kinase CheA